MRGLMRRPRLRVPTGREQVPIRLAQPVDDLHGLDLVAAELCLRQMLRSSPDERRTHVDTQLGDRRRIAAMVSQVNGKVADFGGILAINREQRLRRIQDDEQRHEVLLPVAGGLVKCGSALAAVVFGGAGLFDIVADDSPQPRVSCSRTVRAAGTGMSRDTSS